MTRSKVISALLGLVLAACVAVIVLDQQGKFGNNPWPGSAPTQGENYNLPPADTTNSSSAPAPAGGTTEIQPTPTPPTDTSGYGDLK